MQEELFPLVDNDGNVIGKATRSKCHDGSKLLHPVVHLHVFNSEGKLFLQKRAHTKDVQPDKWDTSSAGHIDYGETADVAVLREAFEELGIQIEPPLFIEKYIIENDTERELSYIYQTKYDGAIKLDPVEVADGRFWSLEEISQNLESGIFTVNFVSDFRKFFEKN